MRVFRMIATPIMLLGLLGLLIWGGLWGWRNLTAPIPTPEATPCVMVEQEFIERDEVVINVYNGGYTRGLAERAASALREAGFRVERVANTEESVVGTTIRGGHHGAAPMRLVETAFVDPVQEYDDRVDGTIDVLVGTEFAGYADPWVRNIAQNGHYCKPAILLEEESASPSGTPMPEETPTDDE